MKISIIIPTLNRPGDLTVAMESLMRQTFLPEEILIVDQSEDGRTREAVRVIQAKYPAQAGIFKYFHRTEKSTARARNFGTDNAAGDTVSYLDDDVELLPDYYEKIVRYLTDNPSWGGVSGNLIQEDLLKGTKGALRRLLWKFFLLNNDDGRMTPSGFGYPIYDRPVKHCARVEMFHGCNMNFRRQALGDERFDEWFVGYSYREDAEFSYRVSEKAQLWMVPDARLYHHESTKNRLDHERLKHMEMRNCFYVYQKHRSGRFMSKWLFRYSMTGLLVIDALERFFNPSDEKYKKFRASVSVYRELLKQL